MILMHPHNSISCISLLWGCIVVDPSRGTPVISKIEELYGEANIPFNCTGYPGYPDGDLEFQVKLQNETDFHDFTFYSATRQNSDLGCIRKQTVNATYFMNMEWNQAKIRCKAKGSDKFDETNVYLLSRKSHTDMLNSNAFKI